MIKPNSIILGDYNDHLPLIPDKSVDMINCDLPYHLTSCHWDVEIDLDELWTHYKRIIKDNGAIVLTASQPFTSKLVMSNLKWFKYEWVWYKSKCGSSFTAKYRPESKHENVLVFGIGKVTYNPQMEYGEAYQRRECRRNKNSHKLGIKKRLSVVNNGTRFPETVQYFQQKWRRDDQLHPTQKPVALYEYLIKTYTNEGDLVLDNCAGSMTTAIACINLNRDYICIEKEKEYYDKGIQRIKEHTRQMRLAI